MATAVAMLMAVGVSGCKGPGDSSAGGSKGKVEASADPHADMMKWANGLLNARSFRARSTVTFEKKGTSILSIEFSSPDRYHVAIENQQTGGTPIRQDFIIVGSKTYTRQGVGPWQLMPGDMGAMIASFRDARMVDDIRKSTDVKFAGPDTLDGIPMLVYTYSATFPEGQGSGSPLSFKTWIAATDGLARRSESEGEIDGVKSKTITAYFDYNADIKIEPPTE
jgi:hypothetical protein